MKLLTFLLLLVAGASTALAADVLVEAESFADHGGWVLDPQFLDVMGSPYLLAHGLGRPVANAATEVEFPESGKYQLWGRTKDWIPSHHPGRFKVLVQGVEVPVTFGCHGEGWLWQDGGIVAVLQGKVRIELADLTGFDGRCDAIYFTTNEQSVPPVAADELMAAWRRKLLGLPDDPPPAGQFDVVVVGGGIAGSSTKTMLNGGQTGVATGAAAFLCNKYAITPRALGQHHIQELQETVAKYASQP